ncbi:MAG: hypothetical protein QME88_12650 [Actinomycetota bacterium]|nr:hypothetical protein [Actinomycetota bacterium]
MASVTSFRRAGKHPSFFLAEEVGHSLLHRRTQRRGSERAEEKRARALDLFSCGVLPESERREAERGCLWRRTGA